MNKPEQGPEGDALSEVSLFPLGMVLFPGAPLPLHIFEERYKAMIGDCLERNEPFGVVLIKEGQEVGAPAVPFDIGTTARVIRSEILAEGRMNIVAKGERRFEITEITQQAPYLVGRVRFLEEPVGEGIDELLPELNEEFTALVKGLTALAGGYASDVTIPGDPVELSYTIAASLNLQGHVRQALLESPSASARLAHLTPLIKRGNHDLNEEIAKRNPYKGPRLN
jgi:Lon protease-like protein